MLAHSPDLKSWFTHVYVLVLSSSVLQRHQTVRCTAAAALRLAASAQEPMQVLRVHSTSPVICADPAMDHCLHSHHSKGRKGNFLWLAS